MWLCVTLDTEEIYHWKKLLGTLPGDRLEGIKVNGVAGNDTYIKSRLKMKGVM